MRRLSPTLLFLLLTSTAHADEGMWTFDNFPSEKVAKAYGFKPDQAWLDKVRRSSVRLAGGCSASFVSPNGLVMTNHHCAHGCIEQLSTKTKNYVERGFNAKALSQEKQCPAMEVNQLQEITDVSAQIAKATAGKEDLAALEARKAEMSKIEKACATSDELRCDVVSLYNGGLYHLYKYRRYQDVRLVFAPEIDIAFFGGDPDNFNFPRYVLDVAFVRVYEEGKPIQSKDHFRWSAAGAKDGELVFVSGHPGSTSRLDTIAQLEYLRDVYLPNRLFTLAELRGMLAEFRLKGKEQARIAKTPLFYVENGFKALRGRHQALVDEAFFASKVVDEMALREQVAKDPAMYEQYGKAWNAIAKATDELANMRAELRFKEHHRGFGSKKFRIARALVRNAEESKKPNEKRLREFTDGKMPALKARLFSGAPIYDDLEVAMMAFSFTKLREELGPDDPFVKKVLGDRSPRQLATRLVKASKLDRVPLRKKLFEGGQGAIEKARDPMIQFARSIDADGRAVRKRYEDQVESIVQQNSELIAAARFKAYGTSTYPDATFTLRLSYGKVAGFLHRGKMVPPLTVMKGAFDRATGQDPFALPRSWLRAKSKLDLSTPMNFVSTNDIIGGNSGSPIFNRAAEIVGIIFDGNIYSLGGDFGFDERVNRAVSVHSAAIVEALERVYGARRLLRELEGEAPSS